MKKLFAILPPILGIVIISVIFFALNKTAFAAETWKSTTTTGAPSARNQHSAVWTGTEMIIWGTGSDGQQNGARYNPSTNTWTSITLTGAPPRGRGYSAVWTGSEMIIWGGIVGNESVSVEANTNTGYRYNPSTNTWIATTTTGAPSARCCGHSAVWTGSEMIIWGGESTTGGVLNTGARYNPSTNTWIATTTTGAPSARYIHSAVWTGSEMIIWGGSTGGSFGDSNTGARYNPSTNTWIATTTTGAPSARSYNSAVWTGSEMIVWGGSTGSVSQNKVNTGARYNPSTNSWTSITLTGVPSARARHSTVWTGSEMIVWGGYDVSDITNTGARYNSSTNTWIATTTTGVLPLVYNSAVWTGSEMIIWGGYDANLNTSVNTGNRLNYTLTVSKTGAGSGTVTSSPAGINCGATCSASYNSGTSVTLTASAASGSTFTGWSGACSGTGSCAVTMNSDQSATANFNANSPTTSTSPVSSVTTNGAALNGSVNPNGLATSAWFEWGTSASLSTYNTTSPSQSIGSGTSAVTYSMTLSGLSSGATYYFRAAASNSTGTTKGTILSFTTTAAAAVGVSISPTNLTVTPGDSCVAALQPTLSWDLSAAMWFSKGWAWSSNIRWISFNSSNCDTDNDGTSNGGSGCPAAGTAMSAYSVKIDSANGNFSGYAWSSRIGWIAFGDYNADGAINGSDESISGAPCLGNCRAKLNLSNNQVTGWARVLRYKSFGGDRGWIKLSGTATNGSTYGIYKNGNNLEGWVWGSENIGWIHFNGTNYGVAVVAPTQSAYQVQVDSEPIFPFPTIIDSLKVISSGRIFTANVPNYGTTYYWRVKIWDTENSESSWVNGPSFGTAAHQYPRVDFEWTPKTPSALETVEFKDKSIVYGGTSISDWLWTFQDAICKTPATNCESVQNPKITFNEVAEKSNKSVSLKVTDSDGFSCTLNRSMPINVKLPEIKEVAPKK